MEIFSIPGFTQCSLIQGSEQISNWECSWLWAQSHMHFTHRDNSFVKPMEKYLSGKNIFLYECKRNQGKRNFWNSTLAFWAWLAWLAWLAPAVPPVPLDLMVYVSLALKRTMYNLKNSFSPNFDFIHRTKYVFLQERNLA